jgi:predicted TIM-barrel enzyme
MKTIIITTIKTIATDRIMTVLMLLFILVCLAYSIYVGVSLHPNDLQVAMHYTAYGETNFYRDKWYYLLTFVAFGVITAVVHTTLTAKMYMQGRRPIALLFLGLSFLLIFIAWTITQSILKIAFL